MDKSVETLLVDIKRMCASRDRCAGCEFFSKDSMFGCSYCILRGCPDNWDVPDPNSENEEVE